jgi:hypothetical protein
MRRFLIMIAMASLSACGLIRSNASWVDDMPQKHAASIAEIIAMLAVERIPPGSKPLRLAPAPLTQSGDTLTASLTSALKARGYRLLTEETGPLDHDSLRTRTATCCVSLPEALKPQRCSSLGLMASSSQPLRFPSGRPLNDTRYW